MFLQDPPAWRTLCKTLKPHSKDVIRNINVHQHSGEILLESPQAFCHIEADAENVKCEEWKALPKTIVCHDMANGYHDDSIIDGTGNYSAYSFYNWGGIDTFIYFSHHLITIPPLSWINVAHAHGVKVLGTVITEWSEGVAFWERVLQSEIEWRKFASALVAIAKTLKFDGWLLNVENKISRPEALLEFVKVLRKMLHAELVDPELVWYDSVTVDGHLNWQNGLNEKNKVFFDAADGFFTNYSWREEDVRNSAKEAGSRLTDLYVGIDVWGRNFFGGGQFNTQQAVRLVHGYGCSLAIFAPAWTHEAMSDEQGDSNAVAQAEDLDFYDRFLLRERAFWGSIWPFLNTKLPSTLPFQTSFCRGQGKKRRIYGEVIGPVPWYNLRHQQYQPNSSHGPHGYLLSTLDNIVGLSRLGLFRNKAGILSYRKTIEDSRLATEGPTTSKEMVFSINADSIERMHQDSVPQIIEEVSTQNERKSVKRKMTRVLRQFFKIKSPKTDDEGASLNDVNASKEKVETSLSAAAESDARERGPSMVQMSIRLQLGNETVKTKYSLGYVPDELECLEPFFEDSFTGGSCLKVNPSDAVSQAHRLSRIFFSDFVVENKLIACVATKTLTGQDEQFLNVVLWVESHCGESTVVLVGRHIPHARAPVTSGSSVVHVYPAEGDDFRLLQTRILLSEPSFYVPLENSYHWNVRYYEVEVGAARVKAVGCRTGLDAGPILLGHFGLCCIDTSNTIQ